MKNVYAVAWETNSSLGTNAAGKAFLAKNAAAEGVTTLPSGLQYKVVKTGAGTKSPKVSTPCACHYAGRLVDGTEFDSSYKRGQPSTFAPNQVIKVRVRGGRLLSVFSFVVSAWAPLQPTCAS